MTARRFAELLDPLSWVYRLLEAHDQCWTPSVESLRDWESRTMRAVDIPNAMVAQEYEVELQELETLLHCYRLTCRLLEQRMGAIRGSVQAFRVDAKAAQKKPRGLF